MVDAFKLIIEDDEGKRNVVPVSLGEVTVGRHEGNAIRLNERNVSRQHMRLVKDNGHVFAEDLDSYNGVFINGVRIDTQHLVDGDTISIGGCAMRFLAGDQDYTEIEALRLLTIPGLPIALPTTRSTSTA